MLLYFLTLLLHSCYAQQNAALIIGGYWSQNTDGIIMNSVELYGCAGGGGLPIIVSNLTKSGYLLAGIYRDDLDDVLVCGGYNCAGTLCGIDHMCQTWNPRTHAWDLAEVPSLHTSRYSHLMAHGPNLNTGNLALSPIAVGYLQTTEIYDWGTNAWSNYRDLPDRNWVSTLCLYQDHVDQEYIYNVRSNLSRLDINTWTVTNLGPVPPTFVSPGRCAPVTIGGHRGLFIHYGFFYNFTLGDWVKRAPPPFYAMASVPNAMWTLNGRPTIFGNPNCNNHGACVNTEVVQYVPESDTWIKLPDLSRSRTYHEVIEVPGSWCDYFVSAPTTTATTTTTTTTRTTTTTSSTASPTVSTPSAAAGEMSASLVVIMCLLIPSFLFVK